MKNETLYPVAEEIWAMRNSRSLSLDEMLDLAGQVKSWETTGVYQHTEKQYSYFEPQPFKFQARVGRITLDLAGPKDFRITASTPLNILGDYEQIRRKCDPRLVKIFSDLESRYIQDYFDRVKSDMKLGLEEARKLIKNTNQ